MRRAGLWLVLAGAAALAAWGLRWGLPGEYGWAPDELLPQDVQAAVAQRFSGGWHSKYPPLHFAVLATASAPVRRFAGHEALMVTGRLVSLAMGLGTVLALFAVGRRLLGETPALLAAALFAASVPFVYYAKTANLDMPYVFWFSLALLFFVRLRDEHRRRDAVLFALTAAAAVATKDQAFALFVLPVLVLAVDLHRHRRRDALVAMAGTGLVALAIFDGLLWNPGGFAEHVRLITGSASRDFRMFPATPQGEALLAYETLRHLAFALGWPSLLAAAAGVVLAVTARPRPERLLATLWFPASYAVFFLAVVLYVYDRFLLPVALVLSLFAGQALDRAWRAHRWMGAGLAGLVLAFAVARAASVNVLLVNDARYDAERWLAREASPPALVAAVGPLEYLPRLDGLNVRRLGPSAARLQAVRPDVVVVNADYAARAEEGSGERAFHEALEDGSLGYRRAYAHRSAPPTPFLDVDRLRGDGPGRIWSNLDKVNPEIRIYRRE